MKSRLVHKVKQTAFINQIKKCDFNSKPPGIIVRERFYLYVSLEVF